MFIYEKKLEFPVKICKTDPKLANLILTQFGGADGELAASLRYFSQKFDMVTPEAKATLNDIATEELAHLEMIGSICLQLSENADPELIKKSGFDKYYVDHGTGIYPSNPGGTPFTAAYLQSKGDPITNLYEDMAAEQKARTTYEYLMEMTDDPDVISPLKFLREREVVHFQRFGEALRKVQDYVDAKRQFTMPKCDLCRPKREPVNKPKCDSSCNLKRDTECKRCK